MQVAVNGTDDASCGARPSACRSIGQAILNAAGGDTIVVGPGFYGDLNRDGALAGAGEELPSAISLLCCGITINKPLTIVSRDGAAETVIDFGGTLPGGNTLEGISIAAGGAVFGRPRKGFTVTGVGGAGAIRIEQSTSGVRVEGNRAVGNAGAGFVVDGQANVAAGNQAFGNAGPGFSIVFGSGLTLTGNLSTDNVSGFLVAGQQHVLADNTAAANDVGISLIGAGLVTLTRNVVTGSTFEGVFLSGDGHVFSRNAVRGNRGSGVLVESADTGTLTVTGNTFMGNGAGGTNCGIELNATTGDPLLATGNFWGAASGPGSDPADLACDGAVAIPIVDRAIKVNPKRGRVD
jgi:parallel beta-helix repeat protein